MKTYNCEIGSFKRTIQAETPGEAARKCAELRAKSRAWFVNQSPMAVSVDVDGVEYMPARYADSAGVLTWD